MTKGILRVPQGTLPKLLSALELHFPDYVVEEYSKKPDYSMSYAKKVESYCHAFEYLLNAYPRPETKPHFSNEAIKSYINWCRTAYQAKTKSTVSALQKELKKFATSLIDLTRLLWNETDEEATSLLNEAEQYALMLRGRPNLATLIPMNLGEKGQYVVQFDKTLAPYDAQILQELAQIKVERYPKTPAWFRELADPGTHFIQAYFCNLQSGVTDLPKDLDDFLSHWNDIKLKMLNIISDLEQIAEKILPLPTWFLELPKHHQEMMATLATSYSPHEIDKKLAQFKKMLARQEYKDTYEQISKLPQWYWVLSRHQQHFLEYALDRNERIEDVVSFLCSRHRTLPMPANFAAHSLHILDEQGALHGLYSEKYRASHIATRDGISLNWPQSVLRRHFLGNLVKVMSHARSGQLALLQTLISPIGSECVPFLDLSSLIPDYKLHKMARAAVEEHSQLPSLVQTNHPFNAAKLILYTTAKNPDVINFLEAVSAYSKKAPGLSELLERYIAILNSGPGSTNIFDYVGRELFLSSLEQLMILEIDGYSFGSCVSGKDRKAIESIHTDAMYLYKAKYGYWPKFEDTEQNRANFVAIVAELYLSRHHHEHAGQNAPGSEGIKTPANYFPADIAKAINKRLAFSSELSYLACDDLLATNNELRKISTGSPLLPRDTLLCKLIAAELGEQKCTQLYDALFLVFNDMSQFITEEKRQYWSYFFSSSEPGVPKGIQAIKTLMDDPSAGFNNVARMAGILEIITTRPEQDLSRTEATRSVYELRRVLSFNSHELKLEKIADDLITEWKKLFDNIKKSYRKSPDYGMI